MNRLREVSSDWTGIPQLGSSGAGLGPRPPVPNPALITLLCAISALPPPGILVPTVYPLLPHSASRAGPGTQKGLDKCVSIGCKLRYTVIDAHETLAFLLALQPQESLCSQTAPAGAGVSPSGSPTARCPPDRGAGRVSSHPWTLLLTAPVLPGQKRRAESPGPSREQAL